ncbi:putative NADH-flavin reductase [Metabacillus crassostreae]|uniref:NAD(P)-dependent oxidoreductase n=1 Tax=Metabacillus crassostreae TaxID=929098 RepID=UPI001956102B|nr:NAD(P)H-binding protein [Metabacillus crassostreae]MBM7602424.1 putative NADH-flavin reductase [Metabacillus crassostreae]
MAHSFKVAIIGGTGKVGRHIATRALEKGYQVRMLVRNPENSSFNDERIEIVKGNAQNIEDIQKLLKGCHVVINTFGQPIKETPIYSKVTGNILEVMTDVKIDRYITVSGGSLTIKGDKKSFLNRLGAKIFERLYSNLMKDKKEEWEILNRNHYIKWTLIRLPFIAEGPGKAIIKEDLTDMPGTKIMNQDIATFIINQIENLQYVKKAPFIAN